eukprot:223926_1
MSIFYRVVFWLSALPLFVTGQAVKGRRDLSGQYYGRYFQGISLEEASGDLYFALNRTRSMNLVDAIRAEIYFVPHEDSSDRKRLFGYGWFVDQKLTLYSNETDALSVAKLQHPEWEIDPKMYAFTKSPDRGHLTTLPCRCRIDLDLTIESDEAAALVPPAPPGAYEAPVKSSAASVFDVHLAGKVVPMEKCPMFDLNITIDANLFPKAMLIDHAKKYAAVLTVANVGQIWLFHRQHIFSSTTARAQRLSLFTMALMAFFDSYLIMKHSVFALQVEDLFFSFALILVTEFVILSIFEMRLMFLIAKAQNPENFEGTFDEVRQQLGRLYCKFYLVLFLGVALPFFVKMKYLIFMFHCTWIPQIVCLVRTDTKGVFSRVFVPGMSALRLVFLLYMWGCPSPSFVCVTNDTDYGSLTGIIGFVAVHVAVLMFCVAT